MKTRFRRIIAAFLLVNILQSVLLPSIASALTSGPTAPETTSFEPVDATDMVSMPSGDFSYTIPLLEVPGPEGGYPLALSYHNGIKPLEDASWVGLGWTLNPGAINRMVNGIPDDQKNAYRSVEDYWEGGQTKAFSVGVDFGIGNSVGMGLDVRITHENYRATGGDVGLSLNVGIPSGVKGGPVGGMSIGASYGTSGFQTNAGIGVSTKTGISLGVGASSSGSSSIQAGYSTSGQSIASVGLNMSSSSVSPSLRVLGSSMTTSNNDYGRISTESKGFSIPVPIAPGVWLSVGKDQTRYWSHEKDIVYSYGTIHASSSTPSWTSTFDSYALLDKVLNPQEHPDPEKLHGGSYPSYDSYQVSGQGISGNIQPYIFENGSTYRQSINQTNYGLLFEIASSFTKKVNFRFINDFSNSLTINTHPTFSKLPNGYPTSQVQNITVNNNPNESENGYDANTQHLPGSKHVQYFTNSEIADNSSNGAKAKGFIDYPGVNRSSKYSYNIADQIGGFSITNESGVTYHYALPIYTYNEYTETKTINQSNGDSWNKQFNNQPYAYTWLLTAVTGPDYYDRGGGANGTIANGLLDGSDWGYWVAFDYGQWTSDYEWRNPSAGATKDINGEAEYFSYGKKEIYYLDAIKTRSHTALFVKKARWDGKGVTNKNTGGFTIFAAPVCSGNNVAHIIKPRSVMGLSKILLLKNEDLSSIASLSTIKQAGSYGDLDQKNFTHPSCPGTTLTAIYHTSDNVLDDTDETIYPALLTNAIKSIVLGTSYTLCPETENSYDNNSVYNSGSLGSKKGKFTLDNVEFRGKSGSLSLPKLRFSYEYTSPTTSNYTISDPLESNTGSIYYNQRFNISGVDNTLVTGQIVKSTGANPWYGLLWRQISVQGTTKTFSVLLLGDESPPGLNQSGTLQITKNPPFNGKKFDVWGDYKPTMSKYSDASQHDIKRMANHESAKTVDVWSLRQIETSLGALITILGEKKKFNSIAFPGTARLVMSGGNTVSSNIEFTFDDDVAVSTLFNIGDVITGKFYAGSIMYNLNSTVTNISQCCLYVNNNTGWSSAYTYPLRFGYLNIPTSATLYGPGMVTKSITVTGSGETSTTEYEYTNGRISYIPTSLEYKDPGNFPQSIEDEYEKAFKEPLKEIFALNRELPSPDFVVYENVKITEKKNGIFIPGEKRYYFYRPQANSVTMTYGPFNYVPFKNREVVLKDKSSKVGSLLKSEVVDGIGRVVNRMVYNYADDEVGESEADYDLYYKQGIIHQAFNEVRNIADDTLRGVISVREEYPSVLKSVSNTTGGITTTTYNKKFDFYSGQPTEILTQNASGQFFLTKTVPARKNYSQLGLKINGLQAPNTPDKFNKNMLTQEGEVYSYLSDANGSSSNNKLLSASVTTWEDDWFYRTYSSTYNKYELIPGYDKTWRKHRNYVWKSSSNPDGTFASFTPFNYTTPPSGWEKTSEVTLYDHYSKPLEEADINGNYATAKMGYNESMVISAASNAKYTEMYYTGCEDLNGDWFGGEVTRFNGVVESAFAHTGNKCLKVTAGAGPNGFVTKMKVGTDIVAGRTYQISVWVKDDGNLTNRKVWTDFKDAGGTLVAGSPTTVTANNYAIKAGGWVLVNHQITVPSSGYNNYTLTVGVQTTGTTGNNGYYDDFRIRPIDAPMTSYVYDPQTGQVTYILGNDHLYTQYQYDNAGRLIAVYAETPENPTGKRKVSEHVYHYKRPN